MDKYCSGIFAPCRGESSVSLLLAIFIRTVITYGGSVETSSLTMSIFKKVIITVVFVAVTVVAGPPLLVAALLFGASEEIDKAYQEQRFEDMIERDRLEDIQCSKMSKKQKLAEMCP